VLLWYAECLVEAGDAATAMTYVNMVRARAADPTGWVYKNSAYSASTATYATQTTPADNYKIGLYTAPTFGTGAAAMTAIRFERRLELAGEGNRFFDLQRYNFDTNFTLDMAFVINRYIGREKANRPLKSDAFFKKDRNEYFPIPQHEIDNMNSDGTIRLEQLDGYK